MVKKKQERLGEIKTNNEGLKMKIIAYRHNYDIDVIFEDGYIVKNRQYTSFQKGTIRNPYYLNTYGVGYIGEGKYTVADKNGKNTKQYRVWRDMLSRCYNEHWKLKPDTYQKCEVCSEWLNYQNFAKWYDENHYTINDEKISLDKDILIKGNKIYSSETCVFVPQFINTLFIKCNKTRGLYPVGVHYHKNIGKYQAQISKENKREFIGYYNTPLEAFNAYKTEKEKYIKEVAQKYKEHIPTILYLAMINYEVEIND